jgi:hypothetical protein
MQLKKISFVERDIEANASYKTEFIKLGGKGVPFFVFGAQTMSGFSQSAFDTNYAEFQRTQTASRPPTIVASASPGNPPQQSGSNTSLQSGDTLVGKIAGIKVYTEPSKTSKDLLVAGKAEEMIYMGEEREGLYRVTTSQGEGWVDKLLVKRK